MARSACTDMGWVIRLKSIHDVRDHHNHKERYRTLVSGAAGSYQCPRVMIALPLPESLMGVTTPSVKILHVKGTEALAGSAWVDRGH